MGVCWVEIGDEMVPLKRERERKKEKSRWRFSRFLFITPRGSQSISIYLWEIGAKISVPISISRFLRPHDGLYVGLEDTSLVSSRETIQINYALDLSLKNHTHITLHTVPLIGPIYKGSTQKVLTTSPSPAERPPSVQHVLKPAKGPVPRVGLPRVDVGSYIV
jgi:hypothetical protein